MDTLPTAGDVPPRQQDEPGEDPAAAESCAEQRAARGDYAGAVRCRERAYAAYRARGETRRPAFLAAYHLAFDYVALYGNETVAGAWLRRGIRLAAESGDCVEVGWVALSRALMAASPAERDHWVRVAAETAERFGDPDLAFDALAYTGLALVELGRVDEGMEHLDEASVAAYSGEVRSGVVAGEIYCKMLAACELSLDVRRSEHWQGLTAPLAERPAVAWASAICRMHYGGLLVVAGRWEEADRELSTAVRIFDETYPVLRAAALVRLAELRVRQGRLEEADRLLTGHESDAFGIRPAARLRLTRGEPATAAAMLHRRLRDDAAGITTSGISAVPLLALLVEVELAVGRQEAARSAARRLDDLTSRCRQHALRGYAEYAAGLVLLPEQGGEDDRLAHLERAVASFTTAGLPLEAARARVAVAGSLAASCPELAVADCEAAVETFARLGAAADLDAASSQLRRLGGRARTGARDLGVLSAREREVLALVAQGLSNPEIAVRLYISPRTVSHHVSHVLDKLDLRNRAEAAAWASAQGVDHLR